ncbi:MAG: tRNA (adenosine(37)-N6)-threonylcarbamoyltransferase complex dimerization subunit type 1 TsaB [Bacilli bacterium]
MKSIFLDTTTSNLIVAIIDEEKNEIISYYNEKLTCDLSTKVMTVIKESFENSNLKPNEIDKIYSVNGPGSFTGVRIGVTICKTYSWTLGIKVIPISSLEVLASSSTNTKYKVALIDARRDCVYAGVYDKDLNCVLEDQYLSIQELYSKINIDECTFISNDLIKEINNLIEPKIDIIKIINKHKNDDPILAHNLNPKYLKITEAEANLKKKND